MGNIDFTNNAELSWYIVLLGLSGLAMLILSAFQGSFGARALNGAFGAGFLGYAIYLAYFFEGGTVMIFFKVFILPVMLIVNGVRSISARREAAAAQANHARAQANNQAQYQAQAQQAQAQQAPAPADAPVAAQQPAAPVPAVDAQV
jgi:predicted lipid-binding transport protein (Tim44 family)